MTDKLISIILGSLLHDIGKVVFRTGEKKNHSQSGYDYLKNELRLDEEPLGEDILQSVLYHHSGMLRSASLPEDSCAYITYIADNIASAVDRRASEDPEPGFDQRTPLESIFNRLNGTGEIRYYKPGMLDSDGDIRYPEKEKRSFAETQYAEIKARITKSLSGIRWERAYIHSLLEILEATLTYVPSSTSRQEAADISLFDHLKLTAAVSSCVYHWLESRGEKDYRRALYQNAETFYQEKAFLLYSVDISGIQKYIFRVTGQDSLKLLRARSFFLEIFMENLIDEILEELELSRTNLLYCGGGHMYALLPNTDETVQKLKQLEEKTNQWLLKHFGTALYAAGGYCACSTNELKNIPEGSYQHLYRTISEMISQKKRNRYSASEIRFLNSRKLDDGARECRICRSVNNVDDNGLCDICSSMANLSRDILYQDFFVVRNEAEAGAVPLWEGKYLVADNAEGLKTRQKGDTGFVRAYVKNDFYTGLDIASKMWTGNYTKKDWSMEQYSTASSGIDRIGVLRMDVDNLGQAFVSGFEQPGGDHRYVTLSRTAAFSRQMTLFFKYHVNSILSKPKDHFLYRREIPEERNVSIVYSGGDDVFLIGAWDDLIEAAVDIQTQFQDFCQGKLTISGGIGLYTPSYPIHIMADEVGELESDAKNHGKNAVTLLEEYSEDQHGEYGGTYPWKIFREKVIGEKYETLVSFFEGQDERGKNFLYNLLDLLRSSSEQIYFVRFIYLLSRMEPDAKSPKEKQENYREFRRKMCQWYGSKTDRRQLITAIYLYVYSIREGMEKEEQDGTHDR